jgi:hypothetical protein
MGINTIVCMFLRDGNQAGQIIKTPYLFYSINMIQTQDTKNMFYLSLFCVLFHFGMCLDCPFLIAPLVFFVYLSGRCAKFLPFTEYYILFLDSLFFFYNMDKTRKWAIFIEDIP